MRVARQQSGKTQRPGRAALQRQSLRQSEPVDVVDDDVRRLRDPVSRQAGSFQGGIQLLRCLQHRFASGLDVLNQ
jgi:hypothetical protein